MNWDTIFGAWLAAKFNAIITWVKGIRTDLKTQIDGKLGVTDTAANSSKLENQTLAQVLAAALTEAQTSLRDGVVPEGDTLKKLYALIQAAQTAIATNGTAITQGDATLQNQIDGIKTLIKSNDVDLDTVQELGDAIKALQASDQNILGKYVKLESATAQTIKGNVDVAGESAYVDLVDKDGNVVSLTNDQTEWTYGGIAAALDGIPVNITPGSVIRITDKNGNVYDGDFAGTIDGNPESQYQFTNRTTTPAEVVGRAGSNLQVLSTSDATLFENGKRVATREWVEASQAAQDAQIAAANTAANSKVSQTDYDTAQTTQDDRLTALEASNTASAGSFVSITAPETITGAKNFANGLKKDGNEVATQAEMTAEIQAVMNYVDAKIQQMN